MKKNGCDFCNDLRNVEPAKYIFSTDKGLQRFLEKADKNKKFITILHKQDETIFAIIHKCPKCGYVFTDEDYDSYN